MPRRCPCRSRMHAERIHASRAHPKVNPISLAPAPSSQLAVTWATVTGEVRVVPFTVIETIPCPGARAPGIGVAHRGADLVVDVVEDDAEFVGVAAGPAGHRHQPAEGVADLHRRPVHRARAVGDAAPAVDGGDQVGVVAVGRGSGVDAFHVGAEPVEQGQRLGAVGGLSGGVVEAHGPDDRHRGERQTQQHPEEAEAPPVALLPQTAGAQRRSAAAGPVCREPGGRCR